MAEHFTAPGRHTPGYSCFTRRTLIFTQLYFLCIIVTLALQQFVGPGGRSKQEGPGAGAGVGGRAGHAGGRQTRPGEKDGGHYCLDANYDGC